MRRDLGLLATALACSLVLSCSGAEQRRQYNVLFIAVDDLRPEIGAYGNRIIKTPNIDKLASWGVRFDAAYAQVPVCLDSRTSMLTGRYPLQTGVPTNENWFRAHPEFITLPRYFKQQGYVTLRTGKIFHAGEGWGVDDTEAWTVVSRAVHEEEEDGESEDEDEEGKAAPLSAEELEMRYRAYSDRIVTLEGNGETNEDYLAARRAIGLLKEYNDKPFFLAVGFTATHSPLTAPRKMIEMYDTAKMPLPVDFAPRPQAPPGFPARSIDTVNGDLFIGRDASEQEAREMIRAYYAATTFADANVGRLLDALERLKLRERTIIVFWGDHGYHLGEKGKWSKHNSLFEVGTRVPMLIVMPGANGNGQASPRVVEAIDLYPTLTALCGLPPPAGLAGQSLEPLLDDPKGKWEQPAYMMTALGKAVRTENWRYAEWDDGSAMLIDHTRDPHELENLANDPAHAETVAKMKQLLRRLPSTASRVDNPLSIASPIRCRKSRP